MSVIIDRLTEATETSAEFKQRFKTWVDMVRKRVRSKDPSPCNIHEIFLDRYKHDPWHEASGPVFARARAFGGELTGTVTKPDFQVCQCDKISDEWLAVCHARYQDMVNVLKDYVSKFTGKPIPVRFSMSTFNAAVKRSILTGLPLAVVAKSTPSTAADYAIEILKHRWPEGEPIVLKNVAIATRYATHFKFYWPELIQKVDSDFTTGHGYLWQHYMQIVVNHRRDMTDLLPELDARLGESIVRLLH